MEKMRNTEGYWGDVSLLKGKPVYIFGGVKDKSVPTPMVMDQKRYFESVGADVSYEMNPNFNHWWNEEDVAGDISNHCYKNRDPDFYSKYQLNDDYQKYGYL